MDLTKHHLLTKEIASKIPMLYSTEDIDCPDKIIHVKFFDPTGSWKWYGAEACAYMDDGTDLPLAEAWDKQDKIREVFFFGLVDGFEKEWGEFVLSELQDTPVRLGLFIERDFHFQPTLFKLIK